MFILAYKVGKCRLPQLLKDADMTQVELAEELGVTVQQVNKYHSDKQRMSLQVAKNISAILNCTIEELYEWIEGAGHK